MNSADIAFSGHLAVLLRSQQRRRLLFFLELIGYRFQTLPVLILPFAMKANERDADEDEQEDGQDDVRHPQWNPLVVLKLAGRELGRVLPLGGRRRGQ